MGKYKTIYEEIENKLNKDIRKQTRLSISALVVIIVGIVIGGIALLFDDLNSSIPSFLFTLSILLILGGVVKLLVSRTCYVYLPTQSRMKSATYYFDVRESDIIQDCLQMKRFDELARLERRHDNGVKVDILCAENGNFTAVQVSEYIPYTFEAITPVMYYSGEEARRLAVALKR